MWPDKGPQEASDLLEIADVDLLGFFRIEFIVVQILRLVDHGVMSRSGRVWQSQKREGVG